MDADKVNVLYADIIESMKAIETKHNVKMVPQGANYTHTSAIFKFELSEISENGLAMTRELQQLKMRQPEVIGKTYLLRGEKIKFTGYSPRAKKYPYIFETTAGEQRKMTDNMFHLITESRPIEA